MSLYSCKEKNNSSAKNVFLSKDSTAVINEEIPQVSKDFSFELNVQADPERGSWQNPDLVIKKLGDLSEKIVADIGSGTGYFTFPISRMAQKVLAIDIEQRYLDYIEERKLELPIEQADVIETRLTVANEPNLHTNEVDAVLMVNVFYYLNDRPAYMKIVNNALRKDGIIVLVDWKPGEIPVGPSGDKVSPADAIEIMKSAGFMEVDVDSESLQYQYIITAK